MAEERTGLVVGTSPTPDNNIVLRQLEGFRREFAAVLENQRRDREPITRIHSHMESGFARTEQAIREVKNDVFSLENSLLNRHNEVLEILRRLDEQTAPVDEVTGYNPAP